MKIWLITDTHFNHAILQKYCGRPENCDDLIKKNLELMVKKDDLLIHLGDVCIGFDLLHNSYFKSLGCKTILVKGNHDRKSSNWYMRNGFDLCVNRFDITLYGKKIAFTHIPIGLDGYFDVNIHGHLHNANFRLEEKDIKLNGYNKLVALEYTDYKPVLLEKFLKG